MVPVIIQNDRVVAGSGGGLDSSANIAVDQIQVEGLADIGIIVLIDEGLGYIALAGDVL